MLRLTARLFYVITTQDGTPLDADAEAGAIYSLDLATDALTRLPVHGLPSELPFQPHGIFASNVTQRLFAVSHGMGRGGSRVIIFDIMHNGSMSDASLSLRYIRSVTSPLMHNLGPNDVVEAGNNELLVSIYQGPVPLAGRHYSATWKERWGQLLAFTQPVFPTSFHAQSTMLRCIWSSDNDVDVAKCTVAAADAGAYNGIAISADRRVVIAADTYGPGLFVYQRSVEGQLSKMQYVPLPYLPDNVQFDAASGCATIGRLLLPPSTSRIARSTCGYQPHF